MKKTFSISEIESGIFDYVGIKVTQTRERIIVN